LLAEFLLHIAEQCFSALFVPAFERIGVGRFELQGKTYAFFFILSENTGQLRFL
jgi:galactose mutarotase-like enzyme